MLSAIKTALLEASGVKEKPLKKSEQNAIIRRQFIVDFLADNPYIMNADVCENLGVASATANRILTDLWHDSTLERISVGKYWAYQLAKKE